MEKIKNMSLADLKAAFDFTECDMNDLRSAAENEGIAVEKIPAYSEVIEVHGVLWNELLSRTRGLK